MRKYRPHETPVSDEWKVMKQVVVPGKYRSEILEIYALPISGHLGVNNTDDGILQHFS